MLIQENKNIAQCTEGCFTIEGDRETILKDATNHSRMTGHKVNVVLGTEKHDIERMRYTSCPNCGKSWDMHDPKHPDTCPAQNLEADTREAVEEIRDTLDFVPLCVGNIEGVAQALENIIARKSIAGGKC